MDKGKNMTDSAPLPPKGRTPRDDDFDDPVDADAVAEAIEAGYDIQSDAAVNPLANDPASSHDESEDPEE